MAKRKIVGFYLDEENHWVAQLACGHAQHVRHTPPWQNRPWVMHEKGRQEKLGVTLDCVRCDRGEPVDGGFMNNPGKAPIV
ncbi:MAG: DUF3565 domain-containing protein [Granulosicoccus sp.]